MKSQKSIESYTKVFRESALRKKAEAAKKNIGLRFGRLVTLKKLEIHPRRNYYLCRCDCGKEHISSINHLRVGNTKSCGCLHDEVGGSNFYTHGLSKTRFYNIWVNIKTRTLNKNCKHFSRYGGRGITFDQKWLRFLQFKKDMYRSYLAHCKKHGIENTSIDRIDNNAGYTKSNCRWATSSLQAMNRRSRKKGSAQDLIYKVTQERRSV